MAHKVKFSLPERELGNADIVFSIHGDTGKMGTLTISKGAIEWKPNNWHKGFEIKHSWGNFDKVMKKSYGYKSK